MHPAAVEQNFRTRAERLTHWGIALLGVAALLWCYAAWQMFTPYDSDGHHPTIDCAAPVVQKRYGVYHGSGSEARHSAAHCAAERDWPRPVAALVLATPLATVGGVLFATGTTTTRLRLHQDDLERAGRD
ncbi:hypothetical protein STXM2123_3035 [Streptomyces sp. F-3]|uniref:Integral membrane protein n=1 Tax=Streptomyces thermogriseus TaxID=75292 RepID=A0ABN1STH8_9ACTN|nr:hypothetical protein [Streptomyces sp. LB8]MDN5380586.1 hypothetical protein [Streptomyces sp. LB8]GAT82334.1 hypothetical protein STXM2123_3035 [Streptomyces sp. F-3]